VIGTDQASHIQFLVSAIEALGGTPISTCAFHFAPVLTDVATWIQFAREMEYIGMSAYQSSLALLDSPELFIDMAQIGSVESRHQTLLNIFNGGSTSAQAYDVALTPSQLLAMAGQFVTGCEIFPMNLPMVPQVPHLFAAVPPGASVNWNWGNATTQTVDPTAFFCQWTSGTSPTAIVQPINECLVPNINGAIFAWITNSSVPLTTDIITQNVDSVVAGPAIAFVDSQMELLSEIAKSGSAAVMSSSVITPAEAGAIIQGCVNGNCSTSAVSTVIAAAAAPLNGTAMSFSGSTTPSPIGSGNEGSTIIGISMLPNPVMKA